MDNAQISFIAWRFYLILLVIALAVGGLAYRAFDLTVLDQFFLRQQGNERVLRLVSAPAFRGMILDRNGFPLAVSTPVYSVWINPYEISLSTAVLSPLLHKLQIKPKEMTKIIQHAQKNDREFVYLRRGLAPQLAEQIRALAITGVYLQKDSRRYYPEGEVTGHVIGLTNVDDQGQEGLELAFNDWLQGEPGRKWVIKDRIGRTISEVQTLQEQKPGHDLILSIDKRIQYLAYRELLAGVTKDQVESASVVVLDAKTGEVLAMVNQPSFNPNNRLIPNTENLRNRAVTDTFEPGSTMKAFSISLALKSGHYTADTVINTSPGWMRVGHNLVKDEHNNGLLTVRQILDKSSNVGVTKMILTLPRDQLWEILHRVGFGEVSGIGFPGEQSGSLLKHQPWGDFTLATLAWGYGLSINTLQLARAYAVIAMHGKKLPVSLLRLDHPPAGEQIMDADIANQILLLLESVVTEKGATGYMARIPGYRVGGKTGTAWIASHGGYEKHNYNAIFVGIAPISDPRLVVAVVMHNPRGKYYHGGTVSGPVFKKIMEGSLRILNVPPDAA